MKVINLIKIKLSFKSIHQYIKAFAKMHLLYIIYKYLTYEIWQAFHLHLILHVRDYHCFCVPQMQDWNGTSSVSKLLNILFFFLFSILLYRLKHINIYCHKKIKLKGWKISWWSYQSLKTKMEKKLQGKQGSFHLSRLKKLIKFYQYCKILVCWASH